MPGIDGGVGLQEVLEAQAGVVQVQIAAALGADDAEGDRVAQAEGAADGQHEVADLQPVAVAQRGGHQVGALERQHGHVGLGVFQDSAADGAAGRRPG